MHLGYRSMSPADYKVLLVDDDPAMLRLLSRWLQKAGYPLRTVADGQEALEAVELECPDFVITDWEMPHVSGLELCRRLRQMILPHYVYIIFLTVRTGAGEMITGLENGADDFLTKPVSEEELLARMKSSARVLDLERRLNVMAQTDALTGLLTQRAFYESLEKEWRRSQRSRRPLSCTMLDLDFFKQINDVHGHLAGDAMLKFVAELLLDNCRSSDVICRYGGEEFCIMLPETREADAVQWAERTRKRMAGLRIPTATAELHVTGSFGVAERREDTQSCEELVDQADQALLCAKRLGRDRVIRYSSLAEGGETKQQVISDTWDAVFRDKRAGDLMVPLYGCVLETTPIVQALELFVRTGAASLPVLDEHGSMTGFISEKDLMVVALAPNGLKQPLSSVMRTNIVSYEEQTPLRTIHEFFCRVAVRSVVITKQNYPVGILNREALLRWYYDQVRNKESRSFGLPLSSVPEGNITGTASALTLRSPDNVAAVPRDT